MLARPGLTITGFDDPLDAAAVKRAALRMLAVLGVSRLSIDLGVMGRKDSVRLNRRFRGKTYAADVLSFPLPSPVPGGMAGEVLIRPSAVARRGSDGGISRRRRLARLTVHGVLHVLGYGHDDADQAGIMRALERIGGT
jgi:probable rRNA maturation factor